MMKNIRILGAIGVAITAVPAVAQSDWSNENPKAFWVASLLEAERLPVGIERTEYLRSKACTAAKLWENLMNIATADLKNAGSDLFSAVDAGSDAATKKAISRFAPSIFEMRDSAIALGYVQGLCYDYRHQLRVLHTNDDRAKSSE